MMSLVLKLFILCMHACLNKDMITPLFECEHSVCCCAWVMSPWFGILCPTLDI